MFKSEASSRYLFIVVLSAALMRFGHFYFLSESALFDFPLVFTSSDMFASLQWAAQILRDPWGYHPYHPYHSWMENIAPLETWYRWWGGEAVYQQAPLYAYLLSFFVALFAKPIPLVIFLQLALGVLHCVVVFSLARRFSGLKGAVIAGLLSAFYGPFIFFQGVLLRDSIHMLLELAALLLLVRALDKKSLRDFFLTGVILACAILCKPTSAAVLSFFLLLVLAWKSFSMRERFQCCVALIFSSVLVVSPLMFRNARVGVKLTALSNRAAESIIVANAADANPLFLRIPKSLGPILESSNGNLVKVVRGTFRTYEGDVAKIFERQLLKVRGLLSPLEIGTNINYYFGAEFSPFIRCSLSFAVVFPFAFLGLILIFKNYREQMPFLVFFLAILPGLLLSSYRARYRLVFASLLILAAAYGIVAIWRMLLNRKSLKVCSCLMSLVLFSYFQLQIVSPYSEAQIKNTKARPQEYFYSADILSSKGRFSEALLLLRAVEEKNKHRADFDKISYTARNKAKEIEALLAASEAES